MKEVQLDVFFPLEPAGDRYIIDKTIVKVNYRLYMPPQLWVQY